MKDDEPIQEFKKTKYWKYMIANFDAIDQERKDFNKEFLSLLNNKTDEMAVVLKCHLIIEYYIDKYISVAFPTVTNFEKINLRFITKIELVNNPKTTFGFYHESLKQFNTLRNKFAHNLSYVIKDKDVDKITLVMNAWNDAGGYARTKKLEMIKQYTMWICSSINSIKITIEKETKKLGIAGYIKWMEEMQHKELGT